MVDKMLNFFKPLKVIVCLLLLPVLMVNASIIQVQPSNQKVVKIAVTDIPNYFSPYASQGLSAQFSHLFFDPLVRWGQEKNIEYRLLAKVKKLKNNKTRFYLKKNIFFHSGNLLTSKDVIWSYNEALKNKYLHRKFQHIIKIKPINNYQFDIQTELTQAQLLDYLTHFFILDSAYYKKNKIEHDVAQSALSPPITTLPLSGTGPYRVASFYAGVNLQVRANHSYWLNQPMYNSLNFVKIKSIDSRLYALLADDIDISESIASKNTNSVELLENKIIHQTATYNALFLVINEKSNDLFKRKTARNAIHLAINQPGMLKHILNGSGSIDSSLKIIPSKVIEPTYNAKRAKYLLKKMDAPEQLSLLVMADASNHSTEVILALENMFKRVGIRLAITEVKTVERWNALQFDYDLTLSTWQSALMNSDNIYQDIFANSLLSNYLDSLFKEQGKALTMQDKIDLFKEYQISDRIVPLFSENQIWATDTQFDLNHLFSVNAIPYWHLLSPTTH